MKHEISILRAYADENGIPIRSTSDLSPLEQWLISKIIKDSHWYYSSLDELNQNKNKN